MSLVGLIGAHRTGKTTLAQAYANQNGMNFVETSVSAIFKQMGIDPKTTPTFSERLKIQEIVLDQTAKLYAEASLSDRPSITDRTPLDMLAYTLAEAIGESVPDSDIARLRKYTNRCFEVTNRYFSTLILVQPGIPIVKAEGKAAANVAYIEHLSSLMFGLMMDEQCGVSHFYIRRSVLDLAERMKSIDRCLSRVDAIHSRELNEFVSVGGYIN